ncbi:ComEC/Rec2 family competence protein [Deinococcus cavernae]|uniref:ComEC/Rec2 family competence protein n=1 Tax=Deinococcus cavernae TaxID=2320857 RepID=UPI001F19CA31|nr:ComEC/Rec2 family competence protein [Deinococcus cavernae]
MSRPPEKPRKTAKKSRPSSTKRPAERRAERRTTGADLLALLVVGITIALAACNRNDRRTPPEPDLAGSLTVRFLDVGQGDAVLIRSPEGKTLLVDGGRSTTRMAEHMRKYQIDKIDLMVATHADADHIAGLVEAAGAKPTYFINNGLAGTTQTWERLVSALQSAGTTFQKANNQVFNLGSAKVRIIAPPAGMGDDQNDNSVGVRVDFGEFHALLTGDSEKPETTAWLNQNRPEIEGPVQVYKSIHHGAANGDHQAWLTRVRAGNVVISVGENTYGHPTATALNLYKTNGIKVYRTDQQGTVTFTGKADGTYKVNTER